MKIHVIVRVLLLLALALGLFGAQPVVADGPENTNAVTPQLALREVTEARTEGWMVISVVLTAPDGSAIGNQAVSFYQEVEFFGMRTIDLGTATTDAAGVATLAFQPAQTGTHLVTAKLAGSEEYAAAETSFDVEVTEVVPAFEMKEDTPLASIRRWLSLGVGALVVGVWVVLLGVVVMAVRGIRAAGRTPSTEPGGAHLMSPGREL